MLRASKSLMALVSVLCCGAFASPAIASAAGSIEGTVIGPGASGPIEDTQVCAEQIPSGAGYGCALTEKAGTYTITGLPAGEYKVEFDGQVCVEAGEEQKCSPAWAAQYYQDVLPGGEPTPVIVEEGKRAENFDAALQGLGKIVGTVESATGGPIANTLVCVNSQTEYHPACTFTESSGEYDAADLPPGEYNIEFKGNVCEPAAGNCTQEDCEGGAKSMCSLPYVPEFYREGVTSESEGVELVKVEEGMAAEASDALTPAGTVEGTVTTVALGKAGIGAIEVCAEPTEGNLQTECAATKADGHYTVEGLNTGEYRVRFNSEVCTESGECSAQYERQYYDGTPGEPEATPVKVVAPQATTAVNASLLETSPKAPTSVSAPVLSGSPSVAATLSCSEGTWAHSPTVIAYSWLRNGVAIGGQGGSTYVLSKADEGSTLSCEAIVANTKGIASAVSNSLSIPAAQPSPVLKGTPIPGGPAPVEQLKPSKASVVGKASAARSVTLTLKCAGEGACVGSLRLVYVAKPASGHGKAKKIVVGAAAFAIAPGDRDAIAVKLTSKGVRYLARSGRHGLKLKLTGSGVTARTLLVRQ